MKIDLSNVRPHQCSKPGCTAYYVDRHHTGCEAMWLRHFRSRRRTKRFIAFRKRYYEYRADECVAICRAHHTEIHEIYIKTISAWALQMGKMSTWSWDDAEALMAELRLACDRWIVTATPGSTKPRSEFHNETT